MNKYVYKTGMFVIKTCYWSLWVVYGLFLLQLLLSPFFEAPLLYLLFIPIWVMEFLGVFDITLG